LQKEFFLSKSNDNHRKYREIIYDGYFTQKVKRLGKGLTADEYSRSVDAVKVKVKGWLPNEYDTPILDLGCGTGQFLYLLEQLGYTHLIGVDLSSEQVEIARQWCSRASIIYGNAKDLLTDHHAQFGLITAFDVIEHLDKAEAMEIFTLIEKSLQPGGRVIIQTPNASSPLAGAVMYGDFTHEWFYTPVSLGDVLRLNGFINYSVRPSTPYPHGVKSVTRTILWQFLNLFWKFCNVVETGSQGSGIFTRVFLASATKSISPNLSKE
jgi:2-polyprenyl-3-methyl-5-hydroxy-6-metoxy-1,4-benzoquinol methylase